MTHNTFLCNDQISLFYRLAEKSENLTVVQWFKGWGYTCTVNGTRKSFYEYTTGGDEMDDPLDNEISDMDSVDKNTIIGLALGGITLLAILSVIINLVYQNWWLLQFKYSKWKWQKNSENNEQDKKTYDAFISYAGEDTQWVSLSIK